MKYAFKIREIFFEISVLNKNLLNIKVNDMTSGFRIYSRECLKSINYENTKSNVKRLVKMTCTFIQQNLKNGR